MAHFTPSFANANHLNKQIAPSTAGGGKRKKDKNESRVRDFCLRSELDAPMQIHAAQGSQRSPPAVLPADELGLVLHREGERIPFLDALLGQPSGHLVRHPLHVTERHAAVLEEDGRLLRVLRDRLVPDRDDVEPGRGDVPLEPQHLDRLQDDPEVVHHRVPPPRSHLRALNMHRLAKAHEARERTAASLFVFALGRTAIQTAFVQFVGKTILKNINLRNNQTADRSRHGGRTRHKNAWTLCPRWWD